MFRARFFVLVIVALSAAFVTSPASFADDAHCHVAPPHEPSPAEKASLLGKAEDAEKLYRDALAKTPHDAVLAAGLVRSLLRQQKVEDADSTIHAELATAPNSVTLLTALAEVQYREGKIAEAAGTADQALHADPCSARLYLLRARILRLNSMYASERRAIDFAHRLDPSDLDIHGVWIQSLALTQRVDEQKHYLAVNTAMDAEERSRGEKYLDYLQRRTSSPEKTCHLASTATSAELPLIPLMSDGSGRHIEGWGLHVFLNNKEAGLEVDSGASGLVISRAVADRAGLHPSGQVKIGGVGDEGPQSGFTAMVDSIRVGGLEFRDCTVMVTDRKNALDIDGIIGTDVFSSYLVTIDYPMRKFSLSQLPPRPNEGSSAVALSTESGEPGGGTATDTSQSTEPQDRYIDSTMKDYSPLFRSGHFLILPTVLNGKTQRLFVVDSGAFSSIISPAAAEEVTKVHGGSPGTIHGLSGKVAKVSLGDQIVFQFAGIRQTNNALYAFDTSHISRFAGMEISGFLGNTILRELVMHIDYRDGLIKFDYDIRHGNHDFSH